MKGIVQEFYHQHNKYRLYSMTIKMKEKRRWIAALFSWGSFTGTIAAARKDRALIWHSAIRR